MSTTTPRNQCHRHDMRWVGGVDWRLCLSGVAGTVDRERLIDAQVVVLFGPADGVTQSALHIRHLGADAEGDMETRGILRLA